MHMAKCLFAECQNKGTQQGCILLSAKKGHSAKYIFAECQKKGTRQSTSLPSAEKKHSANPSLPSAEKNTRQTRLCRVQVKIHSTKLPALGKVPVSGSASWYYNVV